MSMIKLRAKDPDEGEGNRYQCGNCGEVGFDDPFCPKCGEGAKEVVAAKDAEIARLKAREVDLLNQVMAGGREQNKVRTLLLSTQESAAKMRAALEKAILNCWCFQQTCDECEEAKLTMATPTVERGLAIQRVLLYADELNISEPSFDDSRLEWVEVQIDRDELKRFRDAVNEYRALTQEDPR